MNEDYLDDDELLEIEISMLERQLLEAAYDNAYIVITERMTFEELFEEKLKNDEDALVMAFDPDKGPNMKVIIDMIKHYSNPDYEEYEKCAELLNKLHVLYPESKTMNLDL
jgi:hypothetical protein